MRARSTSSPASRIISTRWALSEPATSSVGTSNMVSPATAAATLCRSITSYKACKVASS
ncbi:Uncharacterised protein [Mycobacterium tuberculosis]|nr:Uncharacterised protein [Mycobacterium tuberculosis]CPA62010.1 Uncharacterised protein [Mycobacterium tuberculosis]